MRSRMFRLLVAIAILVWGWAAYRLLSPFLHPSGVKLHDQSVVLSRVWTSRDSLVRDPFHRGDLADEGPGRMPSRVRPPASKPSSIDSTEPPKLSAFLGGEPAMAILDSAGATRYAQKGDAVFGWKVHSLESSGVVLVKGSRRVVLR